MRATTLRQRQASFVSTEQREERLARRRRASQRQRVNEHRARDNAEEREERLYRRRAVQRERSTTETAEQREERLAGRRLRARERHASETAEQREVRLARRRVADTARRASQSEERREAHLQRRRVADTANRASQSEERREARLQRRRVADTASRASQSEERREARLQRRRVADTASRASQSEERREARLQRLRATQRQRTANESAEDRDARLLQLRAAQQQRIANESTEDRDTRLLQLRTAHQQRIANESTEDRDARLLRVRSSQQQQVANETSELQLFQQPRVRTKMQLFHARLTSLQTPKCITCQERFPGMNVRQAPTTNDETECVRCSRDKHIPKMYSTPNNMNPGAVPPELMVCVYFITTTDYKLHLHFSLIDTLLTTALQGLTQVEEMLISAVMPIMSIYRLPHGQYGYSGHVINLPQDVASFATRLPRLPSELDVIVVRKEGAGQSHRDFRVRRSIVQCALQWLVTHNKYYHANHVHIDVSALEHLPEDGNISQQLTAITVESHATDDPVAIAPTTDSHANSDTSDPYNAHLPQSFVPVATQSVTEQEAVQQSVEQRQSSSSSSGLPLEECQSMSSPLRATSLVPSPLSTPLEQVTS